MKAYLKVFKIPFLIFAVILVIGIGCRISAAKAVQVYERTNRESKTEERVFDYGNKLTAAEEEALRKKIAKAEKFCGCDIVIVTLDESLEDYALSYQTVAPYQYTMVYADNFYEENLFGFNAPFGDGAMLVDNWHRESDGSIYSWFLTSGKVQDRYSSSMIDETLNVSLEMVNEDPAYAYGRFVELVSGEMGPYNPEMRTFGGLISVGAGLVAALIFYFVNYGGRRGKKTVTYSNYVRGGRPVIKEKEDIFLTKTVTKRRIQTDSDNTGSRGGGGGGSHISSGGHSFGGGGHSR